MRASFVLGTLGLSFGLAAVGQRPCSATALPDAADAVAAVRHQLKGEAVPEADPNVPPAIAAQLGHLKDALTRSAEAAFACAATDATPEQVEKTLTAALHANLANAAETSMEIRDRMDVGAYGSDLSVQVFQLFGRPKVFEVDFRYGIECGDDNLLLIFELGDRTRAWHYRLRWDAPAYRTVGDAFGDFIVLTPVTGSYKTPVWRYVVAHGHPGCAATPRQSRFDMDLLRPTEDATRPSVSWHFAGDYLQGGTVPRLATTEDTIEMRFTPEASAEKTGGAAASPATFRFRLNTQGEVKPAAPATTGDTQPSTSSSPLSTP